VKDKASLADWVGAMFMLVGIIVVVALVLIYVDDLLQWGA
jgi:hypothetical protein